MVSLALFERELRVALRKRELPQRRVLLARWAVGIICVLLLLSLAFGGRTMAGAIQWGLMVWGLIIVFTAAGRASTVVAMERQNGTLGLLLISSLDPMDIFLGKLLSSLLIAFTDLLLIVPLLALPFLMGGVSFELFAATIAVLPVLLCFAVALALFASCLSEDEGGAFTLTLILGLLLCGVPALIWLGQDWFSVSVANDRWLLLSPAYGPYLVFNKFGRTPHHLFWLNWACTMCWSAVLLLGATLAFRNLWMRESRAQYATGGLRAVWTRWMRGNRSWRTTLRNRWLPRNPCVWAELCNRRPLVLAWAAISTMLGLWLLAWGAWGSRWVSVPNFFVTAGLLNILVGTLQLYATAERFAIARRDGQFEHLLTTPLPVEHLVEGHFQGRRIQFKRVLVCLLGVQVTMAWAGLFIRSWTGPALVTYSWVWLALMCWACHACGLIGRRIGPAWTALNSGRIRTAVFGQQNTWVWVWIFYCLFNAAKESRSGSTFPSGSTSELLVAGALSAFAVVIVLAQRRETGKLRAQLIAKFRDIITEPLPDPDDRRHMKWKSPDRERFPNTWTGSTH